MPRFLFDQHVNVPAMRELRDRGIDVVHTADVGLAMATDPEILRWAQADGRVVVTRNYRDFGPLATALVRRRESFPGVLFYPTSVSHGDVAAHVERLLNWIAEVPAGIDSVQSGYAWL